MIVMINLMYNWHLFGLGNLNNIACIYVSNAMTPSHRYNDNDDDTRSPSHACVQCRGAWVRYFWHQYTDVTDNDGPSRRRYSMMPCTDERSAYRDVVCIQWLLYNTYLACLVRMFVIVRTVVVF